MKQVIRILCVASLMLTGLVVNGVASAGVTSEQIQPPKQATYSGVLMTRTSGKTTICKSEPETDLDFACSLTFTLNKDICAVNANFTSAGRATYTNYNGALTSWEINLVGNPTRIGYFTGTAVLTPQYTFVRVSINATHFCDEEYQLSLLAGGAPKPIPGGVFTGDATYRAGS